MKTRLIIRSFIVIAALICPFLTHAQSSRCVILEKDGNRALVSCNGSPAQYVDLRGKADIYAVGDTIDISEPFTPYPESKPQRHR